MSTSNAKNSSTLATAVRFGGGKVLVSLADGREIGAPLGWFPKLRDATKKQRAHWRLIGKGLGIRWDDLDEDISVAGLLK